MGNDSQIYILLGRPYLAILCALIDVKIGKLTLSIGDDNDEFNLLNSMKSHSFQNSIWTIDIINQIV